MTSATSRNTVSNKINAKKAELAETACPSASVNCTSQISFFFGKVSVIKKLRPLIFSNYNMNIKFIHGKGSNLKAQFYDWSICQSRGDCYYGSVYALQIFLFDT